MKVKIIFIILATLLTLSQVIGQTTAQDAIFEMKKEVSTAENILLRMEYNIKKDKHKEMEKQIHDFKNTIASLSSQKVYLQEKHFSGLRNEVYDIEIVITSFEKIVHKSRLFDKDKLLKQHFENLKIKLNSAKEYIDIIQEDIDEQEKEKEKEKKENDTIIDKDKQSHQDNHGQDEGEISVVKPKMAEIETQIHKIEASLKKNNFKDIAWHATKIQNLSLELNIYSQDKTSNEMISINTLANSLKIKAEKLESSAKGGYSNHHQIHEDVEAVENEFKRLEAQVK